MSRKTVRKYIAMQKPAKYSREGRQSVIAPYTYYVRGRIDKHNLSAVRIYEEIREKGYPGSYATVKRLCRVLRNDRSIQAVYHYETGPGEQSQVDFGEFGKIELEEKSRKLAAFAMILRYSRRGYFESTTYILTENVIKMHLNAFSFNGEITDTILYNNMKQIVIGLNLKVFESRFNQKFMNFAEYYVVV